MKWHFSKNGKTGPNIFHKIILKIQLKGDISFSHFYLIRANKFLKILRTKKYTSFSPYSFNILAVLKARRIR